MTDPIDAVVQESERFLKEEVGAEKCKFVDVLEFTRLVGNRGSQVQIRKFDLNGTPFTQAYLELNGEYVYSTTID